jgi:hypothetical protein
MNKRFCGFLYISQKWCEPSLVSFEKTVDDETAICNKSLTKSLAPLQKEIQEREKRYGKAQEHYKNVQQVADIKILQRAKIIACKRFCGFLYISQKWCEPSLVSFEKTVDDETAICNKSMFKCIYSCLVVKWLS